MNDTKPEKDWQEDWHHENGMYYCRCVHCKERFIGYKRRVVCKECHTNLEKASTMMSDKGYEVGSLEDIPQRDGYGMNERIKELAEQAKCYADENSAHYLQNPHWIETFEQKFAELIVRECIGCCEQVISDPVPKNVDTWLNGGSQCISEIKRHFGVEE